MIDFYSFVVRRVINNTRNVRFCCFPFFSLLSSFFSLPSPLFPLLSSFSSRTTGYLTDPNVLEIEILEYHHAAVPYFFGSGITSVFTPVSLAVNYAREELIR